jgi:hypothetical protein
MTKLKAVHIAAENTIEAVTKYKKAVKDVLLEAKEVLAQLESANTATDQATDTQREEAAVLLHDTKISLAYAQDELVEVQKLVEYSSDMQLEALRVADHVRHQLKLKQAMKKKAAATSEMMDGLLVTTA